VRRSRLLAVLAYASFSLVSGLVARVPAQPRPDEGRPSVTYETVAPGLLGARKLGADLLPATLEVQDLIVGPGKSAPALPVRGPTVVELRSGLVETTIDGQVALRRPGEYWVVLPGQTYGLRSLGAMAALRVLVFGRK
jgi:hypothetical protein